MADETKPEVKPAGIQYSLTVEIHEAGMSVATQNFTCFLPFSRSVNDAVVDSFAFIERATRETVSRWIDERQTRQFVPPPPAA